MRPGTREILAFAHPLAGLQLVKGTIEHGEGAHGAATRELREEAGLRIVWPTRLLCDARIGAQHWSFVQCESLPLPHQWTHWCSDDGGHLFRFFWHPLDTHALDGWHADFRAALRLLRAPDR